MDLQENFLCAKKKGSVPASKTDTEEKESLNKVFFFVFFAHKKYSRSFIKRQVNH